uniref:peptidylprolyl isomerase n=1 Tax=Oryza punctata TaxID=4537 RepID=A0A0E0LXH7_ORYPU
MAAAAAAAAAAPLLLPSARRPLPSSKPWLPDGRAFRSSSGSRALSSAARRCCCCCRCEAAGEAGTAPPQRGVDDGGVVCTSTTRRSVLGVAVGVSSALALGLAAFDDALAAGLPPEEKPKLCDAACEMELENVPMVTTESGLQYKDIKVGEGPSPPIGFQVAANYVAMVPNGQIFDSSLEKGQPYIFRVGSGQVIKGLDEGILSMKVGGLRRLYIPGPLAFPKGLTSAPGRPRVPPSSPVMFDVNLLYIPGLDDE